MDACQSKSHCAQAMNAVAKCEGCVAIEVVGETGIEPVTPDLEGPCSIQLSYSPDMLGLGPTLRPQVADT
jgi:hypothetical protein